MKKFQEITNLLPSDFSMFLNKLSDKEKASVQEIRMRINKPIIFISFGETFFLDTDSHLTKTPTNKSLVIKKEVFERTYKKLCEYSVHSNMNSLVNGYITVKGGHRVGVCSTAVYKNGSIYSVKGVSSINIRISRDFKGCSLPILNSTFGDTLPSIILTGRPSCGKTTILRDMALQLSTGYKERYRKVVIVDERSEIANISGELCEHDVGINTDVLNSFSKSEGIEIAVRTLSPEMIICDEIGNKNEVNVIKSGFGSGVSFIVSVHISNENDLYHKPQIIDLLNTNQFKYIVILKENFKGFEIYKANEVQNEINRTAFRDNLHVINRI